MCSSALLVQGMNQPLFMSSTMMTRTHLIFQANPSLFLILQLFHVFLQLLHPHMKSPLCFGQCLPFGLNRQCHMVVVIHGTDPKRQGFASTRYLLHVLWIEVFRLNVWLDPLYDPGWYVVLVIIEYILEEASRIPEKFPLCNLPIIVYLLGRIVRVTFPDRPQLKHDAYCLEH